MKKFHRTHTSGFTLIELLVVISIVSLLSSVALASLSVSRIKAQNAYTISEVRQILINLEIYANEHNGAYPNPAVIAGFYCIGPITCIDPITGTPVANSLANLQKEPTVAVNSVWDFFKAKIAQAATYSNNGFSKFDKPTNALFQCTVAQNPCPASNSWIWHSEKSTTNASNPTISWFARNPGGGPSTATGY